MFTELYRLSIKVVTSAESAHASISMAESGFSLQSLPIVLRMGLRRILNLKKHPWFLFNWV